MLVSRPNNNTMIWWQRRDKHKSGGNVLKVKSMNIEAKLNAKYVVIRRA